MRAEYQCPGCGDRFVDAEGLEGHFAVYPHCASIAAAKLLRAGMRQELHRHLDRRGTWYGSAGAAVFVPDVKTGSGPQEKEASPPAGTATGVSPTAGSRSSAAASACRGPFGEDEPVDRLEERRIEPVDRLEDERGAAPQAPLGAGALPDPHNGGER